MGNEQSTIEEVNQVKSYSYHYSFSTLDFADDFCPAAEWRKCMHQKHWKSFWKMIIFLFLSSVHRMGRFQKNTKTDRWTASPQALHPTDWRLMVTFLSAFYLDHYTDSCALFFPAEWERLWSDFWSNIVASKEHVVKWKFGRYAI